MIKSVRVSAFDILFKSVIKYWSSHGSLFVTGWSGAQIRVYHLLPRRPAEEQSEEDLWRVCSRVFSELFWSFYTKVIKHFKLVARFRASLYPCPETPQERKEMAAGVNTRIDDLQMVCHSPTVVLFVSTQFCWLPLNSCKNSIKCPNHTVFAVFNQSYRYWIKQKTTGRGFCRPLRKPYVCGSSKWGRWRPFITLWTSVISMLLRNVWSLRSGAPFLTSIPFNSLCGGEQWVLFIHDDFNHWDMIYFSHSILMKARKQYALHIHFLSKARTVYILFLWY